jgi:hypothetical protein
MGRQTDYFTQVEEGGRKGLVPGSVWIRTAMLARTHTPLLLQRLAPQRVLSLTCTCLWHPRLYLSPKAVLPSTCFCSCPLLHSHVCLHQLLLPVPGPPVSKVLGLK